MLIFLFIYISVILNNKRNFGKWQNFRKLLLSCDFVIFTMMIVIYKNYNYKVR